ncbi:MAG: lipocalin-like domain-containing protein [bacterium]
MNKIRINYVLLAVLLIFPCLARSESFFRMALPGYQYRFPKDHYSHPDFQTEWWYYTGHLNTEDGKNYGYELTFFRAGIESQRKRESESKWVIKDIYSAHLAISDENRKEFRFWEKVNRKGPGLAGAEEDKLLVWNEGWRLEGSRDTQHLQAGKGAFGINLSLTPTKPPAIHGKGGVIIRAPEPGHTSHYYSLSRMDTEGYIRIEGKRIGVKGSSWMDHAFFSNQLIGNQEGWDWFGIQLDNNTELMLYQLRSKGGGINPVSSGTIVGPKGETQHITSSEFSIITLDIWQSKKSGTKYPSGWQISIPGRGIILKIIPTYKEQELITKHAIYWEGSCIVTGTYKDKKISGLGYEELTGYARSLGIQPPPPDDPASEK